MRKEADFEVMDKITLYVKDNDKVADILARNKEEVMSDVLATDVVTGSVDGYSKEWNLNGEKVVLAVKKNQ